MKRELLIEGFVIHKLATAFDIILLHERRHLEQAKELLPDLKKEQNF